MNDLIIRARNLTKVYRLYTKPHYRFLDMFGLLKKNNGAFTEHVVLDNINLEITKGEKVAIIGRNGAGKSTLLKLITQVIQPTCGQIEVNGEVSALLQIGTGFHPEFTGRENVYSYLAQLGITGKDANRKFAEIVEFSEQEEYIDQPVKTYSTGMGARLMFATSTAIEPELLILDEILGVGDAYFANKSYDRIQEMCNSGHTTVLLVSHDIYSAQKLSDRMIWIDQGRILLDDAPEIVVRGYEDSIRVQEEARLRKKVMLSLQRQQGDNYTAYLEIRTSDGRPLACPVWFSHIALSTNNDALAVLAWNASKLRAEVVAEGTSWGDEEYVLGEPGRWMAAHGIFHKIAARFEANHSTLTAALEKGQLTLDVAARTEQETRLLGELTIDGRHYQLEPLIIPAQDHAILRLRVIGKHDSTSNTGRVNTTGRQGSGAVLIDDMRLLDADNKETFYLRHGNPATFLLDYRVIAPGLAEYCDICLVFFRSGTRENICRIITRDIKLDSNQPKGTIRLDLDRVAFGTGTYSVWVFIAKNGYLASQQHLFYSINPDVYLSQPDVLEFEVSGDLIATNTAFVGEGRWAQL